MAVPCICHNADGAPNNNNRSLSDILAIACVLFFALSSNFVLGSFVI